MDYSTLDQLLRDTTVFLSTADRQGNGTGFFVAPGQILTCAHVIGDNNPSQINVKWKDRSFTAAVQNYSVEIITEVYDWPDLALLKIDFEDHPCVLLLPEFELGDELYSFGYTDKREDGDSTTIEIEGISGNPEMLKFKEGQIRPGLSGGPLLNLRTGGVCGLVSVSRDKNSAIGGRGIPTAVVIENNPDLVLEQARYHGRNALWIDLLNRKQQTDLQQIPRQALRDLTQNGFGSPAWRDISPGLFYKLSESPNINPYGAWKLASPVGAYVRTLLYDGTDNALYAGMDQDQGVFKSIDGGLSWIPANIGLGCKSINCLEINPHNNLIIAGTDEGVWASDNQGASWKPHLNQYKDEEVLCVGINPDNPDFVFAGTRARGGSSASAGTAAVGKRKVPLEGLSGGHLHFSIDGGKSWKTFPAETINDCMFSPHDGRVAYFASIDGGLIITRDGFESIVNVKKMEKSKPGKIAMPIDDENVIAVGSQQGLYLSVTGGDSWSRSKQIGKIPVSDVAFVNNLSTQILAATTQGIFESLDGGKSWKFSDGPRYKWSMAIAQDNNQKIFVGTSGGGVYHRNSKGRNWEANNLGFPALSFISIAASQGALFAGGNGVHYSEDGGSSWRFLGLDGQNVVALLVSSEKPVVTDQIDGGGFHFSRDGGKSWSGSPADVTGTIYAGTEKNIYTTSDNGKTWLPSEPFGENFSFGERLQSFVVSSAVPSIMYAAVNHRGVYRSRDQGTTWEEIGAEYFPGEPVNSLKIGDLRGELLFACTASGKLFWSRDEGESWTSTRAKFKSPITDVHIANNGKIYVSSVFGEVFESSDEAKSFSQIRRVQKKRGTGNGQLFLYILTGKG